MTQSFLFQYIYFIEVCMIVAGVIIAISSFDDAFVDIVYWVRHLLGLSRSHARELPEMAVIEALPERPIAILVPCWQEHEVIFSMLASNSRLLRYTQAHYFVGTYINDPETQAEIRRAQSLYPNVHMVVLPHEGPTSKADCLNKTVSEVFQFENEHQLQFAGMVMHDSEDLIHPYELKLFNFLVDRYDFVQLPVYSFTRPLGSLVSGTYMDEFAEMHTKDLEVRQVLSGVIPCAGVSACFTREAIQHLIEGNAGEAFRTSSFTEDYDVAFRVSELGFRTNFIAYKSPHVIDIDLDTGLPAILNRELPIATREFFPTRVRDATRQRARWLLGIVFQGYTEFGWKGSLGTKYFLMRDRKSVVTSPAVMLAYFCLANLTVFQFYRPSLDPQGEFVFSLLSTRWAAALFTLTLLFLFWRLFNKMMFTGMIYGWRHGLMAAPRLVVGNFINFFASWRAVRVYLSHRLSGTPLVWDKTTHSYPVDIGELALAPDTPANPAE